MSIAQISQVDSLYSSVFYILTDFVTVVTIPERGI